MPDTDQDRAPEPERGPAPQKDELSTAELAQSTDPRTDEPRSFAQEGGKPAPLLDPKEVDELRGNWESIQIGFVDEPRKAVEDIGWPKCSPTSGPGWKASGAVATMSRPKTCAWPCGATARSWGACCRSDPSFAPARNKGGSAWRSRD